MLIGHLLGVYLDCYPLQKSKASDRQRDDTRRDAIHNEFIANLSQTLFYDGDGFVVSY